MVVHFAPLPSFPSPWLRSLRGPEHCPVPEHHQWQPQTGAVMGLGQCCSPGSSPSAQGASVPVQTPTSLAQDPLWALQELLGEFSSLTWEAQEHKSLLGEDQTSWFKEAFQRLLLLQKGAKPPLKYPHRLLEPLRLEKTFKDIEDSSSPSTAMPTTKQCPQGPHPHDF